MLKMKSYVERRGPLSHFGAGPESRWLPVIPASEGTLGADAADAASSIALIGNSNLPPFPLG